MSRNQLQLDRLVISSDAALFEKVYTHQSINRASRKIGMDAGHLSRVIKKLETSIGSPLFTRHKNGLAPTLVAENLYKALNDTRTQLLQSFHTTQNAVKIRIGFHPVIGFRHMNAELTETILKFDLSPEFTLASSDRITELLKARELDFGIIHGAVKMPGMIVKQIESQSSVLVSRDGKSKNALVIHPDSNLSDRGVNDLKNSSTWFVPDHFLIANMVSENSNLMGIMPTAIAAASPKLKIIRMFKDKSKVTAVTWPGSVGVQLIKALQK